MSLSNGGLSCPRGGRCSEVPLLNPAHAQGILEHVGSLLTGSFSMGKL
jgi:hypothetical protein